MLDSLISIVGVDAAKVILLCLWLLFVQLAFYSLWWVARRIVGHLLRKNLEARRVEIKEASDERNNQHGS